MKKLFVFFALLAGIAVMTGCQKDQDVVTLKAVIDQDTKAYFGTDDLNLPYWDADDQVYVNGSIYDLDAQSVSTTFATISNVPTSDVYCAIYPANVVEKMGTPNVSGTPATIYFDPHQNFIWDATNGRQRVNMPMGAVTTGTEKTLYFKNLCSILRMKVKNQLNTDFAVKRLTATSFGGYVAGSFDVTLSKTNAPVINRANLNNTSEDNTLTLHVPDYLNTAVISSGDSMFFDIVVPPFDAEYVILEAEMYNTDGSPLGYSSDTVGNTPGWAEPFPSISLDRNKIVTLDLNVNTINRVIKYDYGYLIPGPDFNQAIRELIGDRTDINTISFNQEPTPIVMTHHLYYWDGTFGTYGGVLYDTVNNRPTGWVEVQTSDSPHKIWAYIDGTTVKINSWATLIYANTDCSEMFKDLPTISNIQWNTTRDFGFQTEDVTDMSYMFAGDTSLTTITAVSENNIGVLYFNTTNVTNMAHMFDSCIHLMNLKLSFNTHNVKGAGMVAMFKDCYRLQSLDISSFNTERITDMSELFSGCKNMTSLDIRKFVISSNTTITTMCDSLNFDHHYKDANGNFLYNQYNPRAQNRCMITCKNATWNTIKGQADINNNPIDPTTGLDLRIVDKSTTNVGK